MPIEENRIRCLQCWLHIRYLVESLEEQLYLWLDNDPQLEALYERLMKPHPVNRMQPSTVHIKRPPYQVTLYDVLPKCNHCFHTF